MMDLFSRKVGLHLFVSSAVSSCYLRDETFQLSHDGQRSHKLDCDEDACDKAFY